jgi:hypothetical protein
MIPLLLGLSSPAKDAGRYAKFLPMSDQFTPSVWGRTNLLQTKRLEGLTDDDRSPHTHLGALSQPPVQFALTVRRPEQNPAALQS